MDHYTNFPNPVIGNGGTIARIFSNMGISDFHAACRWVHELPYGYNSNRDDLLILFQEKKGSCTTKHAVIGTLADELNLAIKKNIGIYPMSEAIVDGTQAILDKYKLPYVPMAHCFLVHGKHRVDLTEGNANGKKGPINDFLLSVAVEANISKKDEYLLYRKMLTEHMVQRPELEGVDIKTVLQAREESIALLRSKVE